MVIATDGIFFFMRTAEDIYTITCLCSSIIDANRGYGACTQVTKKGTSDPHCVSFVLRHLEHAGLNSAITLQIDGESAIVDLAKLIAAKRHAENQLRQTPTGPKPSNAVAKRFHQSVEGLVHTGKLALEAHHNMTLKNTSILTPWLVRHSGWLHSHYQIQSDGRTSFERVKHRPYDGLIVEFGECASARQSGPIMQKMEPHWVTGIWLGKSISKDEHIVATPQGLMQSR